jgi:phenylacetate-CoA ligase
LNLPHFSNRSDLEAHQLTRLRALVETARNSNSFYAEKLRGLRLDGLTLHQFREAVPFTFKRELIEDQEAHPPWGTNLSFPIERYTRLHLTNGTTGNPLRWLDTAESWDWMLENWAQVYRSAGVTAGDRVYFAFSFGPFLGFWTAFEAAARLGCLCIPGGGVHTIGRLRAILDQGATVLCCTPTYAMRLAEVAGEEQIDTRTSRLRRIIVAGEPGGSITSTRARIEGLWPGASVVDHHGMTELGPVSYGCPERPGALHVMEAAYIAEVIDPTTGAAVEPGSRGELILTNLGRTGSPLLRYRTGDIVERGADGPCSCGSLDLALEGGILARTDDMVIVRGVNLYPSAIENVLRACEGVVEYKVVVHTERVLPEITIQVELDDKTESLPSAHHLEAVLQNAFTLRIPVSVLPSGTLPRFEMKAKRWFRV